MRTEFCPVQLALYPITTMLKATGVPVTGKAYLRLYSWFWLMLCLQSEIYTSAKKVKVVDMLSASAAELTEHFNRNFFLLSNLFFDTSVHFFLVFTLSSTLNAISTRIKEISKEYLQAKPQAVQRISRTGAAYLVLTASALLFQPKTN